MLQLDGGVFPNLALMRLAGALRVAGHDLEFRRAQSIASVERGLFDDWDAIYASAIFERTRPVVDRLRTVCPGAVIGGTGSGSTVTLEEIGMAGQADYRIYPGYMHSVGFTQRGCRLKCPFCVVPQKEGAVRQEATIWDIWRGDPYPRNVCLLDNDFFGQPAWRERMAEIRDGGFKVSFNQGINVRLIDEEIAEAIASVRYYDDGFQDRRLYTAWDNRKDEARLFRGLELLAKHGVRPDHIMVYMLIGYWAGETANDWEYRRRQLRAFGCRPYPMPFVRNTQTVGFQRWVVRRADLHCSWEDFMGAHYRPERVRQDWHLPLFEQTGVAS